MRLLSAIGVYRRHKDRIRVQGAATANKVSTILLKGAANLVSAMGLEPMTY
jgi:hypothetical protein